MEDKKVFRVGVRLLAAVHFLEEDEKPDTQELAKEINEFANDKEVVTMLYDFSVKLSERMRKLKKDNKLISFLFVPRLILPANEQDVEIINNFVDDLDRQSAENQKNQDKQED